MADKFINIVANDGSVVQQRLVDMGDGTYAVSLTEKANGSSGGTAPTGLSMAGFKDPSGNAKAGNVNASGDLKGEVYGSTRTCLGMQTITALSSSTAASLTVPNGAVAASIEADGGPVRMALDGTNPTATAGLRIDDGTIFNVDTVLSSVKLLAQSGTTTNVQIAYYNKA